MLPWFTMNLTKMIKKLELAEEELKVEEEWVWSEYGELDIQHVIYMLQTNHWTDVPRDVEVQIAKHRVMCVWYVPLQVHYVLDFDAMAEVIKETDVTVAERLEMLSRMDQTIPRGRPLTTQAPLTPQ